MKLAYHFAPETLAFDGVSQVHKISGYDDYLLPQLATWLLPPEYDEKKERLTFSIEKQAWCVEARYVTVYAYLKNDGTRTKEFDDKSLVTEDYTLKKPSTQWDEWKNGNWVTNLSNQYIYEYAKVDATRSALYAKLTDPLEIELARKQRQGETDEVQLLSERINQLESKVKAENPYPAPPVN